jgi:hypothetical protein
LIKEAQVEEFENICDTAQAQYVEVIILTRLKEVEFAPDMLALVKKALNSGYSSLNG